MTTLTQQPLAKANINKTFIYFIGIAVFFVLAMLVPDTAHAAGLSQATSALNTFKTSILPLIRIACIIAFMIAGIGFVAGFLDKTWFIRAIGGVIIVGSASEIVGLFL